MAKKYRMVEANKNTSNFMPVDIERIERTLLLNQARDFHPIDDSKIIRLEDWEDMDGVYISKEYELSEFTGSIITKENLMVGNSEVQINALWDTGASFSSISPMLAKQLKLIPIGKDIVETSGGKVKTDVFHIHLILNEQLAIPLKVNTFCANKDVDFLIGMDVITKGKFIIRKNKNKILFNFTIVDE